MAISICWFLSASISAFKNPVYAAFYMTAIINLLASVNDILPYVTRLAKNKYYLKHKDELNYLTYTTQKDETPISSPIIEEDNILVNINDINNISIKNLKELKKQLVNLNKKYDNDKDINITEKINELSTQNGFQLIKKQTDN